MYCKHIIGRCSNEEQNMMKHAIACSIVICIAYIAEANIQEKPNLIFFGCQVTDNNPERATLVEIAVVVTDWQLNIIAEGPSIIIHQPDAIITSMDDYFKMKYTESALLDKIRTSKTTLQEAEEAIITFIASYTFPKYSPMVGGIWFGRDARTIRRLMPRLAHYFSTKNYGTFVLRCLADLWCNDHTHQKTKSVSAMHDAYEAINEMRYYKNTYFR